MESKSERDLFKEVISMRFPENEDQNSTRKGKKKKRENENDVFYQKQVFTRTLNSIRYEHQQIEDNNTLKSNREAIIKRDKLEMEGTKLSEVLNEVRTSNSIKYNKLQERYSSLYSTVEKGNILYGTLTNTTTQDEPSFEPSISAILSTGTCDLKAVLAQKESELEEIYKRICLAEQHGEGLEQMRQETKKNFKEKVKLNEDLGDILQKLLADEAKITNKIEECNREHSQTLKRRELLMKYFDSTRSQEEGRQNILLDEHQKTQDDLTKMLMNYTLLKEELDKNTLTNQRLEEQIKTLDIDYTRKTESYTRLVKTIPILETLDLLNEKFVKKKTLTETEIEYIAKPDLFNQSPLPRDSINNTSRTHFKSSILSRGSLLPRTSEFRGSMFSNSSYKKKFTLINREGDNDSLAEVKIAHRKLLEFCDRNNDELPGLADNIIRRQAELKLEQQTLGNRIRDLTEQRRALDLNILELDRRIEELKSRLGKDTDEINEIKNNEEHYRVEGDSKNLLNIRIYERGQTVETKQESLIHLEHFICKIFLFATEFLQRFSTMLKTACKLGEDVSSKALMRMARECYDFSKSIKSILTVLPNQQLKRMSVAYHVQSPTGAESPTKTYRNSIMTKEAGMGESTTKEEPGKKDLLEKKFVSFFPESIELSYSWSNALSSELLIYFFLPIHKLESYMEFQFDQLKSNYSDWEITDDFFLKFLVQNLFTIKEESLTYFRTSFEKVISKFLDLWKLIKRELGLVRKEMRSKKSQLFLTTKKSYDELSSCGSFRSGYFDEDIPKQLKELNRRSVMFIEKALGVKVENQKTEEESEEELFLTNARKEAKYGSQKTEASLWHLEKDDENENNEDDVYPNMYDEIGQERKKEDKKNIIDWRKEWKNTHKISKKITEILGNQEKEDRRRLKDLGGLDFLKLNKTEKEVVLKGKPHLLVEEMINKNYFRTLKIEPKSEKTSISSREGFNSKLVRQKYSIDIKLKSKAGHKSVLEADSNKMRKLIGSDNTEGSTSLPFITPLSKGKTVKNKKSHVPSSPNLLVENDVNSKNKNPSKELKINPTFMEKRQIGDLNKIGLSPTNEFPLLSDVIVKHSLGEEFGSPKSYLPIIVPNNQNEAIAFNYFARQTLY